MNITSNEQSYEYILFTGYLPHQSRGSSKGMFEKFEPVIEQELSHAYCTSVGQMCVAYAYHRIVGYQFYKNSIFPVKHIGGWQFYLKHKTNELPLDLKNKGLDPKHMQKEFYAKYKENIIHDFQSEEENEAIITKNTNDSVLNIVKNDAKYISYSMNVGRVNNQLVSFESMIQYSIFYNRTLVIPWPRHKNHVMGFECGMWDFNHLRSKISIILENELPEELKNYRKNTPRECQFKKTIGKGIPNALKCQMIYLFEGEFGIFHFKDGPKNVMQFIIPAIYIRNAVEIYLKNTFGANNYRIGVHRRAMNEGGIGKITQSKYVCRWMSHGIIGDSRFSWLRNYIKEYSGNNQTVYDQIIAIYHHSCAMDFYDIQNILIFHKQMVIEGEQFYIAHDHQEQNVINEMKHFGGIEQPNAVLKEKFSSYYWSKADECFVYHKKYCQEYGYCVRSVNELQLKEEILFDMWALFYSEFLVGTWMSTFTRTVCHWKGFEEGMKNGNQCWLKWKWQQTLQEYRKNGEDDLWFTLQGLNESALFDIDRSITK